ncbi:MAG: hypothetical protein AAFR59_04505 [Bacteroidota bacterium]
MPSYYIYRDGQRYDRQLLELAISLTKGRGDGRISKADAEKIVKSAQDGRGITPTEQLTLFYIQSTLPLTQPAQAILFQTLQVSPTLGTTSLNGILAKFGVEKMELQIQSQLVTDMLDRFPGEVTLEGALEMAVDSILYDGEDRHSPLEVLADVGEIKRESFETKEALYDHLQPALKRHMNEGYLTLLPIWEDIPENARGFQAPPHQEASENHWIFCLSTQMRTRPFWVIVDRMGRSKTYNYGA